MDKILLFIPMYNCEKQIVRTLSKIVGENEKYFSEIIIVNNRSTDNSENAVIDFIKEHNFSTNVKVLRNDENYGLGGSHKVAFNYAIEKSFDYVVTFHGDDQGRIDDIITHIENGDYKKYDCLLGGRFMNGSKLEGYSKFRTFGNIVYNIMFSIVVWKKLYDLGAGINMYSTKILKDKHYIKFEDNLMFNYYDILYIAHNKINYKFFSILWREEDQVSNVKMFSQATKTIALLLDFMVHRSEFLEREHRTRIVENYTSQVIYSNNNQ